MNSLVRDYYIATLFELRLQKIETIQEPIEDLIKSWYESETRTEKELFKECLAELVNQVENTTDTMKIMGGFFSAILFLEDFAEKMPYNDSLEPLTKLNVPTLLLKEAIKNEEDI